MKKFVITSSALLMSLTIFAGVSEAAPKNSSGQGWKVKYNSNGMWSLKHNFTYTIKFMNKDSMNKSRPYLVNSVSYLNAMPEMKAAKIKFVLSTIITGPESVTDCPNRGDIVFTTKTTPLAGKPNYSATYACYHDDNSAWGGHVVMDADYWKIKPSHARTTSINNIHAHELGHIIGLDHPDRSNFNKSEVKPVMDDPAWGYQYWKSSGKYPAPDTRGIRRLIWNGS